MLEFPSFSRRILFGAALVALIIVTLGLLNGRSRASAETHSYLPIVSHEPTPTPVPPPHLVSTVALPGAECPNAVHANAFNGIVYIANTGSSDVSVLQNDRFLHNVPTGKRPTDIASIPNSNFTYVTNLSNQASTSQIALFDAANLRELLPEHFEPHDVIVNPVNGLTYVTDLDSTVTIYDFDQLVTHLQLPGAGWVRSAVADPKTGLVYAASWERGIVYVIDGTTVIDQFQAGWGILEMKIDPVSGYIYIANSDPSPAFPANVSVFHRDDYTVTYHQTAPATFDVAVDPLSGYAYFANFEGDSVTVLKGRQLIHTVPTGKNPTGVVVNPQTGFAIVTNEQSDTVTVFKNGSSLYTEQVGKNPYKVAVNSATNTFYIINRNLELKKNDKGQWITACHDASVSIYR